MKIAVGGLSWQNSSGTVAQFRGEGLGMALCLLGYELVEPSEQADFYLALNHFPREYRHWSRKYAPSRRILVVWEPAAVIPENFSQKNLKKYGKLLSFNSSVASYGVECTYFDWPQQPAAFQAHSIPNLSGRKVNSVGFINTNKVAPMKGNNFQFRRNLIAHLSSTDLDTKVAGGGWTWTRSQTFEKNLLSVIWAIRHGRLPLFSDLAKVPPRHLKDRVAGWVDSKREFLGQCRFAVVVENTNDYVSEKLFDAIAAGCVPLYYGPKLTEMGIPEGLAIQMDMNPRNWETIIRSTPIGIQQQIFDAGQSWIRSPEVENRWAAERIFSDLAREIDSYIRRVSSTDSQLK